MRLTLFKDGTAIFSDRKPMHNLKIEVKCNNGELRVGSKSFPIVDGVATVGTLPAGEYKYQVVNGTRHYLGCERIMVSEMGMAHINTDTLCDTVAPLKESVEKLLERVNTIEDQIKIHEERISGYSLFD